MMQERVMKLSLEIASHQAQTCQGPAEQHCGCAIVRNSHECSANSDLAKIGEAECVGNSNVLNRLAVGRDDS